MCSLSLYTQRNFSTHISLDLVLNTGGIQGVLGNWGTKEKHPRKEVREQLNVGDHGVGGKHVCETGNNYGKTVGTWKHREILEGN